MTDEKIQEIKARIGTTTITAIAKAFGVSRRTVERIRDGRNYKPPSQTASAIYKRRRKATSFPAA